MENGNKAKSKKASLVIVSLSLAIVFSLGLTLAVYCENGQFKTGLESTKPKQSNIANPKSSGLYYHPVRCGSWPMYFIRKEKIIYLTPSGELIIRSTRNGQVLFTLLPDEPPFGMSRYNLEISIHDHYVIYPYQTTRTVYCVDFEEPKLVWKKTIEAEIDEYPGCKVFDNRLSIRCVGDSICFDMSNGSLIDGSKFDYYYKLEGQMIADADKDVVFYENTLGVIERYKSSGNLLKEDQEGTIFEKDFVIMDKTSVFRTKDLSEKPKWTVDISNCNISEGNISSKIFGTNLYIENDSKMALIDLKFGKLLWCKSVRDGCNMNPTWHDSNFIYYYTSVPNTDNREKDCYKIYRISISTGDVEEIYSIFDTYVKSCSGNVFMDTMPAPQPERIGSNLLFKDKDTLVYLDVANKKTVWSVKLGFMPEMYTDSPIRIFTRGRKKVSTVTGFIFYDEQKSGCYNEPRDDFSYSEAEQEKYKNAYTYIIDLNDGSIINKFPYFSYTISSDDNNLYLINSKDFDYDKGTNKTTVKVIDPFDGNLIKDIDL